MYDLQYFSLVILVLAVGLLISMFRVLREYERGVIFMLGGHCWRVLPVIDGTASGGCQGSVRRHRNSTYCLLYFTRPDCPCRLTLTWA